jgi:hypothetical protein
MMIRNRNVVQRDLDLLRMRSQDVGVLVVLFNAVVVFTLSWLLLPPASSM